MSLITGLDYWTAWALLFLVDGFLARHAIGIDMTVMAMVTIIVILLAIL